MIDNKNLDKNATFLLNPIVLGPVTVAASQAGIEQAAVRMPYSGKIVSIHFYTVGLTDSDDSVRLDVKKGATSVLSATVDPVAAGTTVAGTLKTDGSANFVAGDKLALFATTGAGDAITGGVATIVVRPLAADEASRPSV